MTLPFLLALLMPLTGVSSPPCAATVRELRVRTANGHVLGARLSLPRGVARAPVVLMISGAGPYTRDYSTSVQEGPFANHFFAEIERRLHCQYIGALRFDEIGTGQSTGSYGDHATTMTLAADVAALVDALRREPGVDSARIALLGHSEGGAIAGIVAARRPSVAAVVLLAAPAQRGDDIIRFQIAVEERGSAGSGAAARREHAERSAADRWYRYFLRFSPAPWYAHVRQPLLVLQGEGDLQVTPVQADSILRLARGGGNRAVYCRRYPDVGHGFDGNDPTPFAAMSAVLDDVARFARLTLVDGRPPASAGPACRREPPGPFVPGARLRNASLTMH